MEHKFLVFICNPGLLKHWKTIVVVNPFLIFETGEKSESSETENEMVGWFIFNSLSGGGAWCRETGLKATLGNTADHVIPQVRHFLNVCASYIHSINSPELDSSSYQYKEFFGNFECPNGTFEFPRFDFDTPSILSQPVWFCFHCQCSGFRLSF